MESNTAQGTHMYVLSLQNRQMSACTISGTCTPDPWDTRFDILNRLRLDAIRQYPPMKGSIVVYFALEMNDLTGQGAAR
ncbi:hypothetical protein GCM10010275_12250 [Streptomyces litmocidini]|uniref:hypothetical protein n=1 Tax=Streptomyces litmocidini TaxID=67318 RepID=UPI00167CA5CD|nr:hypothetical protein [Streptomyces litmocidini]GGU78967.1 hypothetical protein GCM10010275_12250 [Streptomyces litmocidini]